MSKYPDEDDDTDDTDYAPQWPIPAPTPAEIEAVLAGMRDGSNVYIRWLKEGATDRQFARKLFWVIPVDEDGLEHEVVACGRTPGEAAAAAWVGACCDDTGDWYTQDFEWRNITEAEARKVPREVPADWTFELHAVPKPITFPNFDDIWGSAPDTPLRPLDAAICFLLKLQQEINAGRVDRNLLRRVGKHAGNLACGLEELRDELNPGEAKALRQLYLNCHTMKEEKPACLRSRLSGTASLNPRRRGR